MGLLALTILGGCNALTMPTGPGETSLPEADAPEATIESPDSLLPELTATATPIIEPTPPPPLTVWPLSADLFYLDAAGQVWRLPLAGDEATAIAVTPPDLAVRDFAVAPGGSWLIARTEDTITIRTLDGRQGRVIAEGVGLPGSGAPDSLDWHSVGWSPDAGMIAYLTETGFQVLIPGAGERGEALIFPVQEEPLAGLSWSPDSRWLLALRAGGGAALYSLDPLQRRVELGHLNGHAWLADGRLAFAPAEGGLALVTPGEIESRVFLVPQDRQITLPTQRADGMLAFFSHNGSADDPGYLNVADPLDLSFRVESGAAIQTTGLAWEPGGARLLGQGDAPGTLRLLDPLTGSQADLQPQGQAARVDWGSLPPRSVSGMTLPADLYYLAPQAGITQIWRLPANGSPPQAVTSAAEDVTSFDISPDGTQALYVSGNNIWRLVINSLDVTRVAVLAEQVLTPSAKPAFSQDGRQIAYANGGIWTVDLDTGLALGRVTDEIPFGARERFTQVYDLPRWSPDGTWIVARVTFYEGSDLALIPLTGAPGRAGIPILLNLFGAEAEWGPDGRLVVYSDGSVYGDPYVTIVQPADPPTIARVLNLPVIDVQLRPDGRLALLRVPIPGAGGPTTVRVHSIAANGSDLQAESGSFVLEGATLSPDTTLIAGLIQPRFDEQGGVTGRLAIADASTGQMFMIDSAADVYSLRWGR